MKENFVRDDIFPSLFNSVMIEHRLQRISGVTVNG